MILPFIVTGIVAGSIYGLAAVGLVLTYKTSGIFNFAHGALAAVSAYVFYSLHIELGWAWPPAAAVAVFVVGPILAMAFEQLARAVADKSLALRVASTIGVLLLIQAVIVLIYGLTETRTVPPFLASGDFKIGSTTVQNSDLVTVLFALFATIGLYLYFRFTRMGASMRAVVESPDLLEISGTSAKRVRRTAWIIGICFVNASGVLLASVLPLDAVQLTLLVVQAYGAAALGAFSSLLIAFAGGIAVGIVAALATKYFTSGILLGIPPSIPFIVLLGVLLAFPKRYLVERSFAAPLHRDSWTTPMPVQVVGGALVLFLLALVPSFAGIHLTDWTVALANVIVFLSLGLLVRTSGQVSLCHVTFLAIGAVGFGHLTGDLGIPWVPAFLLCCLIAVPIGALLAIPAIRLSPLYLALATFGFGIFVQYMFYQEDFMFGSSGAGVDVPRPTWFGLDSDTGFYYLVLGIVIATSAAIIALNHSRLGRLLRGMADSPTAVGTSGVATRVTWVLVFCISAAIAAGGGALAGAAQETVSITSYPPLLSLTYFALIIIVFGGVPWYALAAGIFLIVPPSYLPGSDTTYWLQVLFGVSAILYAVIPNDRRGAPPWVRAALDKRFRRQAKRKADVPEGRSSDGSGSEDEAALAERSTLRVEDLSVRFGGLVAVDDVSLELVAGQITGLIGPNGAGKTTTFNACSGLVVPSSGRVWIDDHDVTRSSISARARRGLGRTFQQMQLFDSLSVRDNVAMGIEGTLAGARPLRHVFARRRDARRVRSATDRALRQCEIADLAELPAGDLSTGQRRLVELARCIAGPFSILLLDEPSSGLDPTETGRFAEILQRVVAERGVGILLVEHDMSLVMRCCEYIYVLDFGKCIFEGTAEEVNRSPVVRAAYLGDEINEEVESR